VACKLLLIWYTMSTGVLIRGLSREQGSSKLPDFGKIQFKDFPRKNWEELLPNAPAAARALVDKLLRYEGSERITAAEVSISFHGFAHCD